ncbi:Rv3235 family protein [Gryllotalpicola koreensis]|uniref:Rv3235 family protein n=1 Tax=Gryllotalpicola koreensis TaxID=993086 RepID=UPI0031DC0368
MHPWVQVCSSTRGRGRPKPGRHRPGGCWGSSRSRTSIPWRKSTTVFRNPITPFGGRSSDRFSPNITDEVYTKLARRVSFAARSRSLKRTPAQRPRMTILSVRTFEPGPGIVEATVVVQMPQRVRAVALRLEGLDSRWRATSISVL